MDVGSEDLFERMFAVQHRVLVDIANVGAFEEWAPLEILAMRVFAQAEGAIAAKDLAKALGCSWAWASRLAKKLKERGLIYEFRWRQYRCLSVTCDGKEWIASELGCLTAFTEHVFGNFTPDERRTFYELLARVRRSASIAASE